MNVRHMTTAALAFALVAGTAVAQGNLASNPTHLPDLVLDSTELSMSWTEQVLETGKYYRWRIVHDGGEEFQIVAPGLFRNSWINHVVIENLEVKVLGLDSVEFDAEGTIDIWFVPIRPGLYPFGAAGYESRGMAGTFMVN